jgi:hypothetical protein
MTIGHTFRRLPFILLTIVGMSLIACVCIAIFTVYSWNVSAEQKIQSALTALDQRFSRSQSLSTNVSDDILLPVQVGDFKRSMVGDCENQLTKDGFCRLATYTDESNNYIYATAKLISGNPSDVLQQLTSQHAECGPENGGQDVLRSTTQYRYVYTICNLALIGETRSLTGITWINGNWLLKLGGQPNNLIQFASQFPY